MSGKDRRPYLSASFISQQLLDFCQDNLDFDLRFIVEIDAPEAYAPKFSCDFLAVIGTDIIVSAPNHGRLDGDAVRFTLSAGYMTPPLVAGEQYFVVQANSDNFKLSNTIGGPAIVKSASGAGDQVCNEIYPKVRISNRNMFVGGRFYSARTNLPAITRTMGEWLSTQVEFSNLELIVSNSDGLYNPILPGGDAYAGMLGRAVKVRIGLREEAGSYLTIFRGTITPEGGLERGLGVFKVIARDNFDRLNSNFPNIVMTKDYYPFLSDDLINTPMPVIYGDWTTDVLPGGGVTTIIVNAADPKANGEDEMEPHTHNVQVLIAGHALLEFQDAEVYVKRADALYPIDSADILTSGSDFLDDGYLNAQFEIVQDSGTTQVGPPDALENYVFETSDEFYVKVKGKDLGAYSDNPVWQARDMLLTYSSAQAADFDATWTYFRDKAAPSQSAISLILSRAHVKEAQSVLEYALSLLGQVRLEMAPSRDLVLTLISYHLEEFDATPTHRIRQWDISEGTLQPQADDRNNFNRLQGLYNYQPRANEETFATPHIKNVASIAQMGQTVSKISFYPNLYKEDQVKDQARELLKIASSYVETVSVAVTYRAFLKDLGDFVKLSVSVSGTQFRDDPMMIRQFGIDPETGQILLKLWNMQLIPFGNPGGWNPGYTGIVGGDSATITEE